MNPDPKAAPLILRHDMARASGRGTARPSRSPSWPEYGEMIGGLFDEASPGQRFMLPLSSGFRIPGDHIGPASFCSVRRNLSMKDYRGIKVRVLVRAADAGKLDLQSDSPAVWSHRKDRESSAVPHPCKHVNWTRARPTTTTCGSRLAKICGMTILGLPENVLWSRKWAIKLL